MNTEPNVFEIRCADGMSPHEILGLLIGYAHFRGFSVEHDGSGRRLTLYRDGSRPQDAASADASAAADAQKVVSFAAERRRLGR